MIDIWLFSYKLFVNKYNTISIYVSCLFYTFLSLIQIKLLFIEEILTEWSVSMPQMYFNEIHSEAEGLNNV